MNSAKVHGHVRRRPKAPKGKEKHHYKQHGYRLDLPRSPYRPNYYPLSDSVKCTLV